MFEESMAGSQMEERHVVQYLSCSLGDHGVAPLPHGRLGMTFNLKLYQ